MFKSDPPSPSVEVRAVVQLLAAFFVLISAASIAGDAFRGTASPWFWHELSPPKANSGVERIVVVLFYSAFYSVGFLIPYWLITFFLFMRASSPDAWNAEAQRSPRTFLPRGRTRATPMSQDERYGRGFAALGCQILFLLFLDSIFAFVRAMPTNVFNGWLMIIGVPLSGFLLYGAYASFFRPQRIP